MCSDPEATRRSLEDVEVVENERLGEGVGLVTFDAPAIAASVSPGQFVHLRIARGADFILRRPFSVHRVDGEHIQILYQVLGRGTRELSLAGRGARMDAIGPLGTGFEIPQGLAHALVVAGGLGVAPMGMLVEALAVRGVAVTVALGAPSATRLLCGDLLEANARHVVTATDDGSEGLHGVVTQLSEILVKTTTADMVYSCGPEAMSRTVAEQAAAAGVRCQVSLERLMGCGVGACLSCVVSTRQGVKKACVDGPVFDAEDVVWDAGGIPPRDRGV